MINTKYRKSILLASLVSGAVPLIANAGEEGIGIAVIGMALFWVAGFTFFTLALTFLLNGLRKLIGSRPRVYTDATWKKIVFVALIIFEIIILIYNGLHTSIEHDTWYGVTVNTYPTSWYHFGLFLFSIILVFFGYLSIYFIRKKRSAEPKDSFFNTTFFVAFLIFAFIFSSFGFAIILSEVASIRGRACALIPRASDYFFDNYREDCLLQKAIVTNDSSICGLLPKDVMAKNLETYRDECYEDVAVKSLSLAPCHYSSDWRRCAFIVAKFKARTVALDTRSPCWELGYVYMQEFFAKYGDKELNECLNVLGLAR